MTVPSRSITVNDGGNGVNVGSTLLRAVVGASSSGTKNQVVSYTSGTQLASDYGYGPLVDAGQYHLENGGGTILVVRVDDTVSGVVTSGFPFQGNDGTVSCTGTPNNVYNIVVEILETGNIGEAVFKYSLDAGPDDDLEELRNWSKAIQVPAGGTYVIPNTGLTLTFADGAGSDSFEDGDLFFFSATAPAYVLSDLNTALDALRAYMNTVQTRCEWVHVVGECTAAIAAGVATKMGAAETAHQYTFAVLEATDMDMISTVTKDDVGDPDVTVAGNPRGSYDMRINVSKAGALGTMEFEWSIDGGVTWSSTVVSLVGGVHILGATGQQVTFAAGPYAATEDYTWKTWDKNRSTWATALTTAYVSTADDRVVVCAGHSETVLPSGKIKRIPTGWAQQALLAKIPKHSTDIGTLRKAGALPGVLHLSHDEGLNPGLDDARFCVGRTWTGYNGFYSNQGRMSSAAGSDFDLVQYRRVMDDACTALDRRMILWVNEEVRVDSVTGYILEQDARVIERDLLTAVESAVLAPGNVSAVSISLRRNENVLSTRTITVDLEVVGLGYIKHFNATIGYKNPALVPVG